MEYKYCPICGNKLINREGKKYCPFCKLLFYIQVEAIVKD